MDDCEKACRKWVRKVFTEDKMSQEEGYEDCEEPFRAGWDGAMKKQKDDMEIVLASAVGKKKAKVERKEWDTMEKVKKNG